MSRAFIIIRNKSLQRCAVKGNNRAPCFFENVLESAHPSAVVADGAAACQAGVKVGDPVRAADWRILVYLTATVHVAAACQVPVSQRQSRPTE